MSVALFVTGAVVAAVGAAVGVIERQERARLREELEDHAAAVRGSIIEGAGAPGIVVRRGGVAVSVHVGERRSRLISAATTWALGPGVVIEVRPPSVLDSGEGRVLVEPAIDRAWLVRGPREVLEPVLDRETRDAMLTIGASLRIRAAREGIWLECSRPVASRARRERVVCLARIAQRFAAFGIEEVRALARRLDARFVAGAPGEPPRIEVDTAGGTVRLAMRGGVAGIAAGGPSWDASLELGRELRTYRGRVGIEGALEPPLPPELLGARALASASAAGVFALRVEGRRASLGWSGRVEDEALLAGCELLGSLAAAPSAGAFR